MKQLRELDSEVWQGLAPLLDAYAELELIGGDSVCASAYALRDALIGRAVIRPIGDDREAAKARYQETREAFVNTARESLRAGAGKRSLRSSA